MHVTDTAGGAKHGLQWRFAWSVVTPTCLLAGQSSSRGPLHEQN